MEQQAFDDIARIAENWLRTDEFPKRGRVAAALTPGRTLLIAGDPFSALRLFELVARAVSPGSPLEQERYMVLANRAYAHNAIARRLQAEDDPRFRDHAKKARDFILSIKDFDPGRPRLPPVFAAWHAMALAEAYRLLGDTQKCRNAVRQAASIPGQLLAELEHFQRLYEELGRDMEEALRLSHE